MKRLVFNKLLLLICIFSHLVSYSQISFEKDFGDSVDVERSFCAKQTYDSGFIVLGTNYGDETGSGFTMLVKTDSLGNQIWSKGIFDFGLYQSWAKSLKITPDSGFIITGGSYNMGGSIGAQDVFLLKTDKNGNQQWVATFDSIEDNSLLSSEYGNDVILTNDGGYLVTGQAAQSELVLLKTDAIGNKQWVVKDTGLSQAAGYALIEAENNTYLVIGGTTSSFWNTAKMYLTKFDANGNKIWGKTYSWTQGNYSFGYSIQINSNGDYVLLGQGTYNSSQYGEMLLIKTDTAGNLIWENSFLKNQYTAGYAVNNTNDTGYILTGYSFDAVNGYNVYLVKTDSLGNQIWDTTYSGDRGYSVQQTFDSGYVVAGTRMGNLYLLKTGNNGIVSSFKNLLSPETKLILYPNPTSDIIKLFLKSEEAIQFDVEVYDINGIKISSKRNLESNSEIILERNRFKKGIYFIKIQSDEKILLTHKIIVN